MNGPSPARRRLVLLFAVISLAALAVRLLHLAAIRPHPWWDLASIWAESDMHQNLLWARHLEAGDWLDRHTFRAWFDWQEPIAPREVWSSWFGAHTYYQPPLYPYFLAVILKLTDSLDAARVAQLALGAINCGLLALLAARLFGRAAGWLTGFGAAIYAPFVLYDAEVLRNTIVLTSQIALLLALASRRFLPAGVFFALAWLADSSVVVFAPLAVIWIWWDGAQAGRDPSLPRWRPMMLFAAGVAIGVAPLCARNVVVGAPLLASTTRAPLAFVMGNAPDANPAGAFMPASTRDILQASGYGMLSTMRETLRGYHGHYAPLLGKQWQKLTALFGAFELPDKPSFYYAARLSPVVHWGLRFLPVAALGIAGLCLTAPLARRDPLMALLPLHLASCAGLFLLAHVVSRYRQPLLISLLPLASFALLQAAAGFRSKQGKLSWRGPAILAAAAALCAVLPHEPPEGYGYNRPAEFALVAQLYEQRGQVGAAIGELKTAAQLAEQEPALHGFVAPLWLNAGLMQAGADQHQEAIASYSAALKWDPDMREAQDAITLSEDALKKGAVHP